MRVEGILGTEKCFVRKSGTSYHVDLHAIVDGDIPVKEGHMLAHRLENCLRKALPELARVIIHIEPEGDHSSTAHLTHLAVAAVQKFAYNTSCRVNYLGKGY